MQLNIDFSSVLVNKLDSCIVWNDHNTAFYSKRSAICVHAVYFLHFGKA